MKTITDDYIPFGEEWEKELMKWRKPDLIQLLKKNLIENQKLNKIVSEANKPIEQKAWEDIANAYPHESHEKNPKRFCDFIRSKGINITDEEIKKKLEETK